MSRDVLAPPLMRLSGGRNYRVNLVHEDFGDTAQKQRKSNQPLQQQGYKEEDLYTEDYDEEEDGTCEMEEMDNGMFKLVMPVPSAFYGGIIGFKGSTKRRIESETRTEIFVPRIRDGGGGNKKEEITIKGKARDKVLAARRQINIMTASLRKRMPKTHFIGVAFKGTEIQEKYKEFKEKVLALEIPGIDGSLFQVETCIHVTIEAIVLLDEAERKRAVDLLLSTRDILGELKTPFEAKASGLEIMNDDPSAVRVLYACIEGPDLQKYADHTMHVFRKAGFAFDDYKRENVKMHMTVMNIRYRNQLEDKSDKNFDAREILKKFGSFDFGSATCNEVLLCVMKSKSETNEFYKVTGKLEF